MCLTTLLWLLRVMLNITYNCFQFSMFFISVLVSLSLCIWSVVLCIFLCIYLYIYVYIYIFVYICVYIFVYISVLCLSSVLFYCNFYGPCVWNKRWWWWYVSPKPPRSKDIDGISRCMLMPYNVYCLKRITLYYCVSNFTAVEMFFFECVNTIRRNTVFRECIPVINHSIAENLFSDIQSEPFSNNFFLMYSQIIIIKWH